MNKIAGLFIISFLGALNQKGSKLFKKYIFKNKIERTNINRKISCATK